MMSPMRGSLIAIFVLFSLCAPARAQMPAAKLEEECATAILIDTVLEKASSQYEKLRAATAYGRCFGFIDAARQGAPGAGMVAERTGPYESCIPSELTLDQLATAFVFFMAGQDPNYKLTT